MKLTLEIECLNYIISLIYWIHFAVLESKIILKTNFCNNSSTFFFVFLMFENLLTHSIFGTFTLFYSTLTSIITKTYSWGGKPWIIGRILANEWTISCNFIIRDIIFRTFLHTGISYFRTVELTGRLVVFHLVVFY